MADDLRIACEAAHRRAASVLGRTGGCCHLVARLLGYDLARTHEVRLVIGQWRQLHHAWLEVGAVRLDPTGDQYGQPLVADAASGAYAPALHVKLVADERAAWIADERSRIEQAATPLWGSAERDARVLALLAA